MSNHGSTRTRGGVGMKTETGRRFVAEWRSVSMASDVSELILAIEREAAEATLAFVQQQVKFHLPDSLAEIVVNKIELDR